MPKYTEERKGMNNTELGAGNYGNVLSVCECVYCCLSSLSSSLLSSIHSYTYIHTYTSQIPTVETSSLLVGISDSWFSIYTYTYTPEVF